MILAGTGVFGVARVMARFGLPRCGGRHRRLQQDSLLGLHVSQEPFIHGALPLHVLVKALGNCQLLLHSSVLSGVNAGWLRLKSPLELVPPLS